jgi:transcriptional regulator with GAF, ATPase, and Fis domain
MASLIVKVSPERVVTLTKSVTSIGSGLTNDVRINDASVQERHAHVLRDRNGFRIFATDGAKVTVNGKRRNEWSLSEGDQIELGHVTIVYRSQDQLDNDATDPDASRKSVPRPPSKVDNDSITESVPLEAFKKLYRFSAKINAAETLDDIRRNLVDAVIELARADTGFLLVMKDGRAEVDVARDRGGEDLPAEDIKLSDSIVNDVIKRGQPLLISDALEDSIFSDSRSVVNYKLRSVIAVPIVHRDELMGVLYLGCDRKPSAFSTEFMDILMVFGAQAGLIVKNAMLIEGLRSDNEALKMQLDKQVFGEIIGGSTSMMGVFRTIARVAPTDISVLIIGETGTGKELIAREIHRRSTRAEGPFVAINTSAIPENLLEAELFGHVKGAFTGAVTDRRGKFVEANGGTLFLDEIGDMPPALQAKLLRVLQERAVEPVGSNKSQLIDIRVVAATNRDLTQMQEEGTFRPDLFFRLNEVQVSLPPLRDRAEDIILLGTYFLSKHSEQMGRRFRKFTERCASAMKRYGWRGNVRELEARVKKAVVMAEGPDIDIGDMELEEGANLEVLNLRDAKEAYARRYILEVLALNDGNRSKTARDLGIDPRTVYKYVEGK